MRHIHFNHTPLVFVALIMALVFGPALAGNLPFMKDNHKDKKTTIVSKGAGQYLRLCR